MENDNNENLLLFQNKGYFKTQKQNGIHKLKTVKTRGIRATEIRTNKKVETGAISYGLPTEAIYDRKIENEVKRLEIELINQKLLKMYESPKDSLINYAEQKIK